jgi:hypothetical protein
MRFAQLHGNANDACVLSARFLAQNNKRTLHLYAYFMNIPVRIEMSVVRTTFDVPARNFYFN